MKKDEIISMAQKAGFEQHEAFSGILVRYSVGEWINIEDELNIFANLIAAAEREACQDRIDTLHKLYTQASQQRDELMDQQREQVEAIRTRGQA